MTAENQAKINPSPNIEPQVHPIQQQTSRLLGEWGLTSVRDVIKLPNHQIESFVQTLKERLQQT